MLILLYFNTIYGALKFLYSSTEHRAILLTQTKNYLIFVKSFMQVW